MFTISQNYLLEPSQDEPELSFQLKIFHEGKFR